MSIYFTDPDLGRMLLLRGIEVLKKKRRKKIKRQFMHIQLSGLNNINRC